MNTQVFLRSELFVAFWTFFISHIDIGRIVDFFMLFQIGITCEGFVTDLALDRYWDLTVGFSVPVENIFEREKLLANFTRKLMISLVNKFFVSPQHPFLFVFLETYITFKFCIFAMMLVDMTLQTGFPKECFLTGLTGVFRSLTDLQVSLEVELERSPVQGSERTRGATEDFSL